MDIKKLADKLGLDEAEYMELIELFVATGHSDIEKIQAAVQASDPEGAANAAHSIKGAAGNLGLMNFHARAKQFEAEARRGVLDGAQESIQFLKKTLAEIEAMI